MRYRILAAPDELAVNVASDEELTGLQGYLHARRFDLGDTEARATDPEHGAEALRELRAVLAEHGADGLRRFLAGAVRALRELEPPDDSRD